LKLSIEIEDTPKGRDLMEPDELALFDGLKLAVGTFIAGWVA
jgi:hypothetical protein